METPSNRFSGWKQPIPTGLDDIFGDDFRCNLVFRELIYRACNKDTFVRFGLKMAALKRGQVIFGRKKYAEYLGWTESTTDRALLKLEKLHNLVSILRTKDYTIVTIKNYEDIIGMNMQMDNQRSTDERVTNTSKNEKSGKNEKNIDIDRKDLKEDHKESLLYEKAKFEAKKKELFDL